MSCQCHQCAASCRALQSQQHRLQTRTMRSKDRLAELRRVAEEGRVYQDTVELQEKEPASPALADLEAILQEAEGMRNWINEMNGNTQLMRRLHSDPTFHANSQLQEQLEACVARAGEAGVRAAAVLRRLEQAAGRRAVRNDARARILRWQSSAARRQLHDALTAHAAALHTLRDQRRALLHDQLRLTDVALTEEECESLLEARDLSMFVDNVRAQTAAARRALREAEVRHGELARLEHALRDVRDLFAQLALLVAAQQERVDSVEYFALQATEHVESGQHELLKGTVLHARARKKKMSLLICLAAGFGVVLLVLVLT